MEKRGTSLPVAPIAADRGLFIHLEGWRPTELERLRNGAGPWMRRIEAAIENWREDRGMDSASIVAVVLLYRRCRQGCIRFDGPESIEPNGGMRLRSAAPIVVYLGDIESSQVEELLRGCGKVLEETRETMRLVQLKVGDEGTARIFVPIVATYAAPQHPPRLKKDRQFGEADASGDAARPLAIRYFRASRARLVGNRSRITIV